MSKAYLLQTKLSSAQYERARVDAAAAGWHLVSRLDEADALLTILSQRRRLERELALLGWRAAAKADRGAHRLRVLNVSASPQDPETSLFHVFISRLGESAGGQPAGSSERSRRGPRSRARSRSPQRSPQRSPKASRLGSTSPPPSQRANVEDEFYRDFKPLACQRRHPATCANEDFAQVLKDMRLARTIQLDEHGERAYSTALASVRSLPFRIRKVEQLARLEGCGPKVCGIWTSWHTTGHVPELEAIKHDTNMQKRLLFWKTWGVGPVKAREWVEQMHWSRLEDALAHWDTLTRQQQCGLKYYHHYEEKMDVDEVKTIARLVVEAANTVAREAGSGPVASLIVGGTRRGKTSSSDCDVMITHETMYGRDDMMDPLLKRLESSGLVNLTLGINATGLGPPVLVAMVDCHSPVHEGMHRRADVIVVPPACVGTAVVGWTGGVTFERDLRRYSVRYKHWRFDSSGIVDMHTNQLIKVDTGWHPGESFLDAEHRVFSALGLEYVPPNERCTE